MKIAGFGDSFIFQFVPNTYPWLLEKHYNATFTSYAFPGSSIWDAYFQFINCNKTYDVVIFSWTNKARFYHPNYRTICDRSVINNQNSNDPVWKAASMYYKYLVDYTKIDYEMKSFFYWLDDSLKENFPNTKFIHMWSFPKDTSVDEILNGTISSDKDYFHRFKNHVELRPSLLSLSVKEDWPKDVSQEHRPNHLSWGMHNLLASKLIYAIDNYSPGLLLNIE